MTGICICVIENYRKCVVYMLAAKSQSINRGVACMCVHHVCELSFCGSCVNVCVGVYVRWCYLINCGAA